MSRIKLWLEAVKTRLGLGSTPKPPQTPTIPAVPSLPAPSSPWMDAALAHLGMKEVPGKQHNPRVVALWALGQIKDKVHDDETAWCAAFVSAIFELVGIQSARTGWARSHLNWGVKLPGPCVGALVIFSRGSGGHVGFVAGRNNQGHLMVLGGNQGNSVSIAPFALDRVLGYRWPSGRPAPLHTGMASLPMMTSSGKLSSNEA